MTDTYNQLKDELSFLNPGITDLELNNATFNLLSLYKLALDIVREAKKTLIQITDVDDTNIG